MSNQEKQGNRTDYLNMSDEELLNAPPPDFSEESSETEEPVEEEEVEEENTDSQEQEEEKQEEEQESDSQQEEEEEETEQEEDEAGEGDVSGDSAESADHAPSTKEGKDGTKDKNPVDKQEPEAKVIDYEAEYKKLLAPFKANGKEIQVASVDEAHSLMKMGANYVKKMSAIKPIMKIAKMLENNNLLDETKLSYLIELDRKNPEAINKLIKDSGIDPMDYDAEKAGEYTPQSHSVSEQEVDLESVLDEIQETPSYNRTLGIISKEWDVESKQTISKEPGILRIINDHVERGVYDIVAAEVERERMFGRLSGLSDLQAYKAVGDAIQARGGFDHLGSSQGNKTPGTKVSPPKPKAMSDEKLKDKKRAASSSKSGSSSTPNQEFNPLMMSDEEFSKIADNRY